VVVIVKQVEPMPPSCSHCTDAQVVKWKPPQITVTS
jgi:hypothetical protein